MFDRKSLIKGAINLGIYPLIMDARAYSRDPARHKIIREDFRKTFDDTAFLRSRPWQKIPGKTVLVLSLSDMIYQLKMESMLCLGLMMKGWRPLILTSRRLTMAHRYFKAFGIGDFVHWENVELTDSESATCERDAADMLRREMSFRSVKEWTYQGVWIGPQLLSSIVRANHLGCPDVNDPAVRGQIARNLPEILKLIYRARRMLEQARPSMVLLVEANGEVYGPITDLAINAGINTIQYVQPWKDDGLIFKRLNPATRRIHPNSIQKATLEKLGAMPWTPKHDETLDSLFQSRYDGKWFLQSRNQPKTRSFQVDEISKTLALDPAKKIAVVFSHILWDANLFYGDDLFEDYGDWFVQTVGAAAKNPHLNWVIKLHPANVWKRAREQVKGELAEITLINKHFPQGLPDHVRLLHPETPISTLSLFQAIDFGVTVRGTVGIELPCLGVPVLTAGTGRYSGLGFTLDSATREEYLGRLAGLHTVDRMTDRQTRLARLHAYSIFKLRPWEMKSFKATFNYQKTGTHPLDHNVKLEARSLEAIRENGDLDAWAAWAESREEIDYISSDEDALYGRQ